MKLRDRQSSVGQGGFTLIELMITISIAAILTVVAVPSFIAFQRNSELTAAANSLLAATSAARTEAMKRNLPAVIAPIGTGWTSGWRIFVDADRSGVYNTGDILVGTRAALPAYFSVVGTGTASGSTPFLRFDGSGFATLSTSAPPNTVSIARTDVSGSAVFAQTRFLLLAPTGRARVCKPASASDPQCGTSSSY